MPSAPGLHVVRLGPDDWESYAALRTAMLTDAPEAYRKFRDKEDGMVKVVFTP